jgi:hypothetical protein
MGKVSIEVLKMSSRATQHIATQQIATLTIRPKKIQDDEATVVLNRHCHPQANTAIDGITAARTKPT